MFKDSVGAGVAEKFYEGYFKFLSFILILILSLSAYYTSLNAPFHYDDKHSIVENRAVHMNALDAESLFQAMQSRIASLRILTNLSFAFNYYLSGLNTFSYHFLSLLIHILTGFFVFLFFLETFKLAGGLKEKACRTAALTSSLLWTLSPVQTQAVTYLSQRSTSLATMFYMLSLLLYIKARKKNTACLYVASVIVACFSFLSKEMTITLPIIILLYEYAFITGGMPGKKQKKKLLLVTGALLASAIILVIYLKLKPRDPSSGISRLFDIIHTLKKSSAIGEDHTYYQYVITGFRVIAYYLSLLLFPHPDRLRLLYDFKASSSLFNPFSTFVSIVSVSGCVALSCYYFKKYKIVTIGILWFFINLSIETFLIKLHLVFEHRVYLPSVGFFLVAGYGIARWYDNKQWKVALVLFVILVSTLWSHQRNKVWNDQIVFMQDNVKKSPGAIIARNNLGYLLVEKGRLQEAKEQFSISLDMDPGLWMTHNNLGSIYLKTDEPDKAQMHFEQALKLKPDYLEPLLNLGIIYQHQGITDKAIDAFQSVITRDTSKKFASAYYNLGLVYLKAKKPDMALSVFNDMKKLFPGDAWADYNIGLIYLERKQYAKSKKHFKNALKINPGITEARLKLGWVYILQKRYNDAEQLFVNILKLQPKNQEARSAMTLLLSLKRSADQIK